MSQIPLHIVLLYVFFHLCLSHNVLLPSHAITLFQKKFTIILLCVTGVKLNCFHMTMDKCYICVKNILTHARKVTCSIRHKIFYVKCISLSPSYMTSSQDNRASWYCTYCIQTMFPFNNIEDDLDFLAEIEQSSPDKSLMCLSDKLLIPFELNDKDHSSFWVKPIQIYITLTLSITLATSVIIFCRVNLT